MPFFAGSIYGKAKLDTTSWRAGLKSMTRMATVGMVAIAAAITAAMAKSIKVANEFQKAMSNVDTLVDETSVNIQQMARDLLMLNPALGSTTELTKGMYQAFSAGAETAAEAMEITTQAAMFARAGLTDTFTAVDVITTAMNAYGKEAMSAQKASDLLFNTIKFGKVTGEQLAGALGASIPLFASVGISMEELTAGMASMTKVGVNANRSTTQLNAIVNAFLKPSEEMSKALERVGHTSGIAFLEAEGLAGALELLRIETDGNKDAIGQLIPNQRGMRGIMALARGGAEEFNKVLVEQGNALGVTQEAFDEQEKTFDTLKNSMEQTQIVIGNIGKHFLDKIVVGAITAGQSIKEFIMSSEGMAVIADVAGHIAGGFEFVRTSLLVLKDEVLPPLQSLWDTLADSLAKIAGETERGAGATKLWAGALKVAGIGFTIIAKVIEINIQAIGDMIVAFRDSARAFDSVIKLFERKLTLDDVEESFRQAGRSISNLAVNYAEGTIGLVTGTVDAFRNFSTDVDQTAMEITTSVKSTFDNTKNYIIENQDLLITGQTDFVDLYKQLQADMAAASQDTNNLIKTDTKESVYNLESTWKDYFSNLVEGFSSVMGGMSEIFRMKSDNEIAMMEYEAEEENRILTARVQQGEITQQEADDLQAQREAENLAKTNELKKKAFETNKRFSIADTLMNAASAVMGWWRAATSLGPIAGPIFAGVMSAATGGLAIAKLALIKKTQFIPSREQGGMVSGMARINESGGEIVVLPDRSIVVPNDISRQIAGDSGGPQNTINVSFRGANISSDMDLQKVTEYVSRQLARELRAS